MQQTRNGHGNATHGPSTRPGWIALAALAVLSLFEFWLASIMPTGILVPLVVLALLKAGLIANNFMHITQLWRPEEH